MYKQPLTFTLFLGLLILSNNLIFNGFILESDFHINKVEPISINLAPSATIEVDPTTICLGDEIAITFNGTGGNGSYTFYYTLDDIPKTEGPINGNSTTIPYTATSTGDLVIVLTSVAGSDDIEIDIPDQTITIKVSKPIVDFTFNNNSCSGTSVLFSSSVTGEAQFDYSWNFGDGSPPSIISDPSHKFNSLGCGTQNFDVTLIVTDKFGCQSTVTKVVTVIQKPDIAFYDTNPGPAGQFNNCGNSNPDPEFLVEVGNSSNSTCINSFNINWGDGNTENNVSFPLSHNYLNYGTYDMVITGIGDNGCSNSVTYVVKNATNPSGGISSPGDTQNLCTPTSELQFSITGWGRNTSDTVYDIDYGDGNSTSYTQIQLINSLYYNAADPVASLNFPIPHSYTESSCPNQFTVKITISNACSFTEGTVSNIIIIKSPEASFEAPDIDCLNTSVLFVNTSEGGFGFNCTPNATYTWDFGDGSPVLSFSTNQNVNHTYAAPGTYKVILTANNQICDPTFFEKEICIEPPLVPTFSIDNNDGCTPLAVNSNNTTNESDSCDIPEYLWTVTYIPEYCGTVTGNYTFTNGTGQNSKNPSFNFIEAGTYTLTLSATNSCGTFTSAPQSITVKQPPTAILNAINDSCGATTVSPLATVDNCAPVSETVTYNWSFPGGTPATSNQLNPGTVSYTTAGDYQITFSVTNSCGTTTKTEDFTINPLPIITNTDLSQTICEGNMVDEIIFQSNDVSTTFSWTTNASSNVIGAVNSGTGNSIPPHALTLSDTSTGTVEYNITPLLGSCTGNSIIFTITVIPAPSFTIQPEPSIVCLGGSPNQLEVDYENGTGTATYQWYSNDTSDTDTPTAVGIDSSTFDPPTDTLGIIYYYCVISFPPNGGCDSIISNIVAVEVVENVSIDTDPLSETICVGGIANELIITHSGGTGTASYQWYSNTTNSNSGGTPIGGATTINFTPPASTFTNAGEYYYYVEVGLDGSGCSPVSSAVATITIVDDPTVSIAPTADQVLCQDAAANALTVTASDGIGTVYNYQWYSNDTNDTNTPTAIGTDSNTYMPLTDTVGTLYYYCVVTQPFSGCEASTELISVTINQAPNFDLEPVSETICLGDNLNDLVVSVINGAGPPTYQWYFNTVDNRTSGTIIPNATSNVYSPPSLTVGVLYYYCKVNFNSGGCQEIISATAEITINQVPVISNFNDLICSDNLFSVIPDNTNGDIIPSNTTYTWNAPIVNPSGSITGATEQLSPQNSISQNLINTTTQPSTVTYTVTPISGVCAGTDFTITVIVNPSITVTSNVLNSDCYQLDNGSIDISIMGGVPFNSGPSYQISWTGPSGFTSSEQNISNLAPGTYILNVNDMGGCPYSEEFIITEPEELIFSNIDFDPDTISCFGANDGSIGIEVSGGTEPYAYSWTRNGVAFATSNNINALSPGKYEITVTDAKNCGPIIRTFTIVEPPQLEVLLLNKIDIECFGDDTGSIEIEIAGGRPSYQFSWVGPNSYTNDTQNITNLIAGIYTITVTDSSQCIESLSVELIQNTEITPRITTTEITCYNANDASIVINDIAGGVPPYNVEWSNLGQGMVQDNLSAGTYIITITDNLNCQKIVEIEVEEAPIFDINPAVQQISCYNENDASIVLNLVGGYEPVSVEWNDDLSAGVERNNLAAGLYTVTIRDSNPDGPCEIVEDFQIFEVAPLQISAVTNDALDCDIVNSGSINLSIAGGTIATGTNYEIEWSNGANTEDLVDIGPGTYYVTVTDNNGCEINDSWVINRFSPLDLIVDTITDFNCETREVDQIFEAKPTGGVPPYQISWSSGLVSGTNNEFMSTEQEGLVIITIIDGLGCETSLSYDVDIPILGDANFSVTSSAYSSFGFYSIQDPIQFTNAAIGDYISVTWDFGDGNFSTELNPSYEYIKEGSYSVVQTVTYPFGCVYTKQMTLIVEKGYSLIMPNAFTPNDDGLNDYFVPESIALFDMQFNIYDTWGSLIYSEEGDNIKGWNGKIKGTEAENGNYYFTLQANTFYGEKITRDGAFSSIK